ncbi:MAG: glutamate-5-semialdehyde dehydrogenase [Ruminococcaceae bacterium]|nr:glutamate-5-semialdehyde dehydrogenase [Oscillospiraceae bacterium]
MEKNEIYLQVENICRAAKAASRAYGSTGTAEKNALLCAMADQLMADLDEILTANERDLANAAENGVPKTMLDRLKLDEKRMKGICDALREVAALPDPIGSGERTVRPNGLVIQKVRAPMGCVAMIYEARPNVTVDAAALCLKTGNAVVLRGGKEAIQSGTALVASMRKALAAKGFSPDLIGFITSTDRAGSTALMNMRGLVDVLIPRGGKGLIRAVVENAKVPVIETGAGNCHLYVDETADLAKAVTVAVNAKCSRPSVCNAIETLLVHESVAAEYLPMMAEAMKPWSVEIRGDEATRAILPEAVPATEEDYETEYNDYILAVRVVDGVDTAIDHINTYSTGHSEAIMTRSIEHADKFRALIDSAAVYVNASTRFTDGGEFGFGAEIGISTQKLHARGPMGLMALTTDKYLIDGDGQVR